ncbi:MAG: poly(A) polymerase [Chlamydiota bacterium]|jgi:poly(A) polymerase
MVKQTYPASVHAISLDKVDREALYVMEKLRAHGHTAYLVGGGVRDLLLGHSPKDFDISTSAKPEEIKQLFRNCILIGRRFRLAHIRFGKKILEVSTFRSGDNETDALILRDNEWGTPEQDVLRRDFTINGLFYDPATEEIIDYVDGYADVKQQLLRTIGQPFIRFRQDPVRMLRLLKFQARFGFQIDPAALTALVECRKELLKSSPVRVLEELLRMLESGASDPFIRLLRQHGFLDLILPALGEALSSKEEEGVFSFLKELDTQRKDPAVPLMERPILLACLAFPLFDKRIKSKYADHEPTPHLGKLSEEAGNFIHELFLPFLQLSRKMKCSLLSILVSQYRFTPLQKKKHRRLHVPQDPDFSLALQFFQLRASLEPAFQILVEQWATANETPRTERPRRRRRRK